MNNNSIKEAQESPYIKFDPILDKFVVDEKAIRKDIKDLKEGKSNKALVQVLKNMGFESVETLDLEE